jgi:hypothetical protein
VGVGIDFSAKMIEEASLRYPGYKFIQADAHIFDFESLQMKFDVILMSDLVNDLWDVQDVLENLRPVLHSGTRIILNYFNHFWRLPISLARLLGLATKVCQQNWFTSDDINNMLKLSGFETVQRRAFILLPLHMRWLSSLLNRVLINLPPFHLMAWTGITVARPLPAIAQKTAPKASVIVAARDEAGNIESIVQRMPKMGARTELIFVEGASQDGTYEAVQKVIKAYPQYDIKLFRQPGKGKGDAVRTGFEKASGDILLVLDADMTVAPEDLPRFIQALTSGKGEFINGVRLVYPMEDKAMRLFNLIGNKFFSMAFSWLINQPIKDTLCGTKVLWKNDYQRIADNRHYFGEFDPFGDFDLIFGAAKQNLKFVDLPIRYRSRRYGRTKISRWRHGLLLLRMMVFAAKRIRFI